MCPFHALASMLAVSNNWEQQVFDHVQNGDKSAVTHANRVLKLVTDASKAAIAAGADPESYEKFSAEKFTGTHSVRHGAASYASEHPGVQLEWLLPRGGWTMEMIQTLFTYVTGSVRSDKKVGLALAGWPSVHGGGKCPGIEAIPPAEHDLFKAWVRNGASF